MTVSQLDPRNQQIPNVPRSDSVASDRSSKNSSVGLLWMALVVAFFVVAGHAWSINSGLWLDDHAHYDHMRKLDWSLSSAAESARLGIVGEVLDLWGQRESGLRFFRPIAFWIMKLEYTVGQWNPAVMHVFCLVWHFVCSMLVGLLALRCFGRWVIATTAAALMAIHPAQTATVYWIACQTELLTTAFVLMGVLAYARYAGWQQRLFIPHQGEPDEPSAQKSSHLFGLIAVTCYALALGCRENAVLMPVVCWIGDRLMGSSKKRWIRWEHLAMAGVLLAYFGLRYYVLGGFPLPGRPYMMPMSDPQFTSYLIEKIGIYTLALFGYVPIVPFGGRAFFADKPVAFYGGFVMTIVILMVIWRTYRFRKSFLWAALWIACFIAPMLPVFASPHHLYLPSVGTVLLITAGLGILGGTLMPPATVLPRKRKISFAVLLLAHALGLGALTWSLGFAFVKGTIIEDIIVEDVTERGREIREGDHLFFINLSPVAYYTIPAIKSKLELDNLQGHVLTFSPEMVRMKSKGRLEILDSHRIRVSAPADQRYFEGVTGQCLLEMMGFEGLPKLNETIDAGPFTVAPTKIDERGIQDLIFTFDEPIDSPNYHFYYGSPHFLAYPLELPTTTAAQ